MTCPKKLEPPAVHCEVVTTGGEGAKNLSDPVAVAVPPRHRPLITPAPTMDLQDGMSRWERVNRADPIAAKIADRHYNRQSIGSRQFVPPGRCVVLRAVDCNAVWVTSWPYAQFTKHDWGGAWINSLFRNESAALSSELILEAVAITKGIWESPPALGMVTFVDTSKVQSQHPGYCYKKAGFRRIGKTKGGLLTFQMLPSEMPNAIHLKPPQLSIFELIGGAA